jgi:4-diphosphocytidyl-2-C-methyl-D-erythritol kinase
VSATAFAPAKVNLFLHVGAANAGGLHPLSSLMVFADVGDRLTLDSAETLGMTVVGPFAGGLTGGEDNLVMRGARALLATPGPQAAAFHLALDKQLPIASGLGGGSSDAGAALRLLRDAVRPEMSDEALIAVAAMLGSDGPACLFGRPVVAEGLGERLSPAPRFPVIEAVLINPGVASPTGAVYRAFDQTAGQCSADLPVLPDAFDKTEALAALLRDQRNDLEAPAIALNPVIGEVLGLCRAAPESLLARVSGSGATCFALCASAAAAKSLADRIAEQRPAWWVRPCRLGGPWP